MKPRPSPDVHRERRTRRSRWWFWLLVLVLLLGAWYWFDRRAGERTTAPAVEIGSPAERAADHDRLRRPAREPRGAVRDDDRGAAGGDSADAPADTPAEGLSPR